MAGKKDAINDKSKPRLSLIPKEAIYELGHALTYGEGKYGTHNYKEGINLSILLDAALRHINQFNHGENIDAESGNNHLGHALASLAMAVDTFYNRPEFDDRYKKETVTAVTTEEFDTMLTAGSSWIVEESDMVYLSKGTLVKKADGRSWTIDTDATYPLKQGDKVIYENKI